MPVSEGRAAHGSDEGFQNLLLRIAAKAAERPNSAALIHLFCAATREFFQVSGVYFWRRHPGDELVGEQADGKLAERFIGLRLLPQQSAVTAEAVRNRRTIFINRVQATPTFPAARQFEARSLMAAPLVVFDEVIGAATFLHDFDEAFFNEDLAAKATILAGQLGSLLEATRLGEASREEHRRAEILAEVANALHGTPDVAAVIEALADRLRLLLRTRLVSVLLRREGPFELRAVSAENAQLANTFRAGHDRQTIRFAADMAQRAVSAGEVITISISSEQHSLGSMVSPGMLIAAPFRTSRTQGAILIYPRQEGTFSSDEKSLVAAIAGFGAVALAHAELSATAQAQAHELHQLLEISSDLSSSGDLEHFLQAFVVRAADFLGFGRCFIALLEDGEFRVRYGVEQGQPRRLDLLFPEGPATRSLRAKEVYWTDEAGQVPGSNLVAISKYQIRQLLAVPLLGADGQLLGMCCVLDRLDGTGISQQDIRRSRALAAQVSVVLEVAHNLHQSEQHRRRAEALTQLARDIDGLLRLPDFARRFVERAIEIAEARAGAVALFQDGRVQTVALHPLPEDRQGQDGSQAFAEGRVVQQQFAQALSELTSKRTETLIAGSAADLLGHELAANLGWNDLVIVRLPGPDGELAGLLCLSGRSRPLRTEDRELLEAIAGHAAMALENSRLFTRIEQANRHWLEIFDAITDFIVVHDEVDKVLRVNRSLAAMIGVAPSELIGVNMRALLALTNEGTLYSCPFCRSMGEDSDEFVHPALDRTYLVSTSRVHGASGERLQTIHVLKDITDRREAERRYRELFDNIQEGLFFSTPQGRFIEVNDALVAMLGYSSREELLQVDITAQVYFSPEQRERHTEILARDGQLKNFEATLRRKNGTPIYVLINAFGMYDSLGHMIQIRGLMLDVTGLHTYQSELQRERDFSGKILSNTQSLILVADTAGLISYANRRWYEAGFEQRELLGRPLLELAAPGYVRPLADALQAILRGGQVDNLELQIVRAQGPAGQFSVNLSPMRDEQGSINSIVVVMTDITDSADLRDKLVHAEKMAAVGQLVSGVAHEVNNPLTAILGFADLLMENPEVPETARKDLRVILLEAQRTKQIVQNLLSFARQMPPQRNPVQLNLILRRTIQLRSYDFNSHGVDVIEHLDEGLPDVIGDAHQLQQVFLNILNNAYDAVHEIGRPARIEIMSTKSADAVEVSFCDNGYGISHADKIFDPFFTTKEVGKGTGLGLSICYGIVKEHGGEILCHNNADGQGATFIVRFPAAPHTASLGVAAGVNQP
ncbi:MAG: signal transduction histidine kinase, nitrogen specific, NtrB [Candidatus Sulfotelmatobacter sp.]|nr:signal transduction histidine kinase, nitrogen specific, NtrB [Candidatus Sulfotelmatobacter sp.]